MPDVVADDWLNWSVFGSRGTCCSLDSTSRHWDRLSSKVGSETDDYRFCYIGGAVSMACVMWSVSCLDMLTGHLDGSPPRCDVIRQLVRKCCR